MSHLDKCRILAFHNDKTHRKVGLARCSSTVAGLSGSNTRVALKRGHPSTTHHPCNVTYRHAPLRRTTAYGEPLGVLHVSNIRPRGSHLSQLARLCPRPLTTCTRMAAINRSRWGTLSTGRKACLIGTGGGSGGKGASYA